MKQFFLAAVLCASAALSSLAGKAQEQPAQEIPKWISEKGYWVVESNKMTPKDATVYFYNNENILVYKEEIRNQKLKLNRKKTLLRFKIALDEAITSYEKGTWAHQNNLLSQYLQ